MLDSVVLGKYFQPISTLLYFSLNLEGTSTSVHERHLLTQCRKIRRALGLQPQTAGTKLSYWVFCVLSGRFDWDQSPTAQR